MTNITSKSSPSRTARWILGLVLALAVLGVWKGPQWLAFVRGVQAYLYGYPLVLGDVTRDVLVAPGSRGPGSGRPAWSAPINQFGHLRTFPTPEVRDVVSPNADTLYSIAWLDLSKEPMVLHTPDMGKRWMLMMVMDAWSNVTATAGTRLDGHAEKSYLVTGPGWRGEVPAGMRHLESSTPIVGLVARTLTHDPADYAAVNAIQNQYVLTPLSQWGKAYTPPPAVLTPDASIDTQTPPVRQVGRMDTAQFFERLAMGMQANPPPTVDAPMLQKLASLGVVPGQHFQPEKLDAAQRQGLDDAVGTVKLLFEMRSAGTQTGVSVSAPQRWALGIVISLTNKFAMNLQNNWLLPLNMGTYGTNYSLRALVALMGYGANLPIDAVYGIGTLDANNEPLDSHRAYRLHFAKNQLPPIGSGAFWSLTMYDQSGFFVDNPLQRYAIGDRDKLQFGADGAVDIFIQHAPPAEDKKANWLPAPPTGNFKVILRVYDPQPQVLDGRWVPPAILPSAL